MAIQTVLDRQRDLSRALKGQQRDLEQVHTQVVVNGLL